MCERADQAIALALIHMESRDVIFVGHGHFSRAVITRWIELPVYEGIRFAMAAASIAMCGFEHGMRQLSALGLTGYPAPHRFHVTREPSFVLATGGSAVVADGVHTAYKSIADARSAITSHTAPIIMGALPFDMSKPPALIRPQAVQFPTRCRNGRCACYPQCASQRRCPTRTNTAPASRPRCSACEIRHTGLHKVVLARALRLVADGPLDARTIVDRLVTADPVANVYLADLTSAGVEYSGTALVGASPELLVARSGDRVACRAVRGVGAATARPRRRPGQR